MGTSAVSNVADILAALAWGPKATPQLSDDLGISRTTAYRWLRELQEVGIIAKQGPKHGGGLYYLNRLPHHVNRLVDGAAEYASWAEHLSSVSHVQPGLIRHTLKG